MDVPHYRRLADFFTRFTTAINEASSVPDFHRAAQMFDDEEFFELSPDAQDELRDHYRARYTRNVRAG